jgi:hypothetical protein
VSDDEAYISPIADTPDDSDWTPEAMAALASAAFSELDDIDYQDYLRDRP